jgi:hypothetical protein
MTQVFAYEVSVKDTDWKQIINAHSAGKAKAEYWRDVNECWQVPYTAIRVRKISNRAETTEAFLHTANYRGLPDIRCGQRVKVGDATGTIVGNNSSANFNVLFDLDSPKFAGLKLNVHPTDLIFALPFAGE